MPLVLIERIIDVRQAASRKAKTRDCRTWFTAICLAKSIHRVRTDLGGGVEMYRCSYIRDTSMYSKLHGRSSKVLFGLHYARYTGFPNDSSIKGMTTHGPGARS